MSKPLQYRKKPVVIEAMRFFADHLVMAEVARWCGGRIDSRGVQGEFYPCKPEIFEATYERVGARGKEAS